MAIFLIEPARIDTSQDDEDEEDRHVPPDEFDLENKIIQTGKGMTCFSSQDPNFNLIKNRSQESRSNKDWTHHIPILLFLILVGQLILNL